MRGPAPLTVAALLIGGLYLPVAAAQSLPPPTLPVEPPPERLDTLAPGAQTPGWIVEEGEAESFDAIGTIDRAITLRRAGDLAGARSLLLEIQDLVPVDLRPWYLYQRGICEELDQHPDAARALYEEAIRLYEAPWSRMRGPATAADARFRLALVLEDLGDTQGALDQMRGLAKLRGLNEDDTITVALQQGIAEVGAGHTRRGVRRLTETLAAVDPIADAIGVTAGEHGAHAWLRAKSRYILVETLLDEAAALPLTGREKRVVANLTGRAERIKAAEEQVITLTRLSEPEWILASLVALGDAYRDLADALQGSTPPRRLTSAEEEIYVAEVTAKAENPRTKAWHLYDQGIQLAERLQFESRWVAVLRARRASIPGR